MDIWEEHFRRLSPAAYAVAFRILRSQEQAEDVVQDLFAERVPRMLEKYAELNREEKRDENRENMAALIITAAKNLALDQYRKNKRESGYFMEDQENVIPFPTQGGAEFGGRQDQENSRIDLRRELERLDPGRRQVILQKYLEGYNWEEVAEKQGLSTQGVRKRASQGLKILMNRLGIHFQGTDGTKDE